MIVKLGNLDRKDTLYYPHEVPIAMVGDKAYNIIGTCRVFRDEQGQHFGELEFDNEISLDLYFYYKGRLNAAGIFIFGGIDLAETALAQNTTTTLREMIVKIVDAG